MRKGHKSSFDAEKFSLNTPKIRESKIRSKETEIQGGAVVSKPSGLLKDKTWKQFRVRQPGGVCVCELVPESKLSAVVCYVDSLECIYIQKRTDTHTVAGNPQKLYL